MKKVEIICNPTHNGPVVSELRIDGKVVLITNDMWETTTSFDILVITEESQ
jgi:hypothetical protein